MWQEASLSGLRRKFEELRFMKIVTLNQTLKCSKCRAQHAMRTCRRILNFTEGEVTYYCRNCRTRILTLPFARWNELNRQYFENPLPAPTEEPRRQDRPPSRRRRNRFRNRNRQGPRPAQGGNK